MSKSKQYISYLFLAISLSIFTFLVSEQEINLINYEETDALHYQILAVNLAHHYSFPDMRIREDLSNYKLDLSSKVKLGSYFQAKKFFNNTLKDIFIKPPLYPLLIGLIYSTFGVNPNFILYFHLVLICFSSVFILKLANQIFGSSGVIIGLSAGIAYYSITITDTTNLFPHFLVQFLLLLVFITISSHNSLRSSKKQFFIGLVFALALLTNGNIVFIPFLYFLTQLISFIKNKSFNKSYYAFLGFGFILLPWLIYANLKLLQSSEERKIWKVNLIEEMSPKMYPGPFLVDCSAPSKSDSAIISQVVDKIFSTFGDDGFVVVSKQLFGDEILSAHNEFCEDGSYHPEWRYLENSYYNLNHSNQNPLLRIVGYYTDNPDSLIKNIVGKFYGTSYKFSVYYYLVGLLLGLLALSKIFKPKRMELIVLFVLLSYFLIPFALGVFLFLIILLLAFINSLFDNNEKFYLKLWCFAMCNTALITMLFVGEPRYIQILDPFLFIALVYLGIQILKRCSWQWLDMSIKWFNIIHQTYLAPLRVFEILLMSGYFLIAYLFSMDLTTHKNFIWSFHFIAILFYIATVYMLNSYADYDHDQLNPRLNHLNKLSKNSFLKLSILFMSLSIGLSIFINPRLPILFGLSLALWFLYYCKPFRFKSLVLAGTIIHFIAGVTHFQIGYELSSHVDYLSIMISFFFATLLAMGHINHELIDRESDVIAGLKTSAVIFGKKKMLVLFYVLFVLSQIYLALMYKWKYIDTIEFTAFFYSPILLIIYFLSKKRLGDPQFIQKTFRILLALSALTLIIFKSF